MPKIPRYPNLTQLSAPLRILQTMTKNKILIRAETTRMIAKDKKSVPLARMLHSKIEAVGGEGTMGGEITKSVLDGMMTRRKGGGATITINYEWESDLVAILRIEED